MSLQTIVSVSAESTIFSSHSLLTIYTRSVLINNIRSYESVHITNMLSFNCCTSFRGHKTPNPPLFELTLTISTCYGFFFSQMTAPLGAWYPRYSGVISISQLQLVKLVITEIGWGDHTGQCPSALGFLCASLHNTKHDDKPYNSGRRAWPAAGAPLWARAWRSKHGTCAGKSQACRVDILVMGENCDRDERPL